LVADKNAEAHARELARELGGKPLPELAALDAAETQALTAALQAARRRQQQQLQQAFEAALGHIPMLLRGPVRKILLP
jgi:hypothetical protein